MATKNNYLIQVAQAQERFLQYDQNALIEKLKMQVDDKFFYVKLLCKTYRIDRNTGSTQRQGTSGWEDANTHSEVMTLMDLICDSRNDRYLALRWKNMQGFGLMFHQNLLEDKKDPWAYRIQENQDAFRAACIAMAGEPLPNGDIAYAIEVFDGLPIAIQFWEGDEEFAPRLRYMWDENALMYLKYETMYFAVNLLMSRIDEEMKKLAAN